MTQETPTQDIPWLAEAELRKKEIAGGLDGLEKGLRRCSKFAVAVEVKNWIEGGWDHHPGSVAIHQWLHELIQGDGKVVLTLEGLKGITMPADRNMPQNHPAWDWDVEIEDLVVDLASLSDRVWGAVAWQVCADGESHLRALNCSLTEGCQLLAEHLTEVIAFELTDC